MSGINDDLFPRDGLTNEQRASRGRRKLKTKADLGQLCSRGGCYLIRGDHAPSLWRRHNPVQGSPRA